METPALSSEELLHPAAAAEAADGGETMKALAQNSMVRSPLSQEELLRSAAAAAAGGGAG
jgi:UDP:flavonoid glycosyltransferase YjiC (YdhE family)